MIKAVIFDYGGVLKAGHLLSDDIPEILNVSKEEVKNHLEITRPFFSLLQRDLITEKEFWGKYAEALKCPMPKNYEKLARDLYQKAFVLYPEMFSFVKKIREKGIKAAVLSNIISLQAEVIRKNDGYDGFDVVVLSYEEKLEKPSPEIYNLTVKKLDVQPDECIFIDDKEKNILTAQSLGMKIVLANNPEQVINDVSNIINLENEATI